MGSTEFYASAFQCFANLQTNLVSSTHLHQDSVVIYKVSKFLQRKEYSGLTWLGENDAENLDTQKAFETVPYQRLWRKPVSQKWRKGRSRAQWVVKWKGRKFYLTVDAHKIFWRLALRRDLRERVNQWETTFAPGMDVLRAVQGLQRNITGLSNPVGVKEWCS